MDQHAGIRQLCARQNLDAADESKRQVGTAVENERNTIMALLNALASNAPIRTLLVVSLLLTTTSLVTQNPPESWKVSFARDGLRKYLGSAVSLDQSILTGERRALIGAPTRRGISGTGSAHVFLLRGDEWVQEQELRATGLQADHSFGSAVGIYGRIALVAAPSSAVVYVFRLDDTEWIQEAALSSNGAQGFGCSVSVWKDRVLIGARGKAYVFRRTGSEWAKEAELGPRGFGDQQFGLGVSLYDRTALIGAAEGYDLFAGKGRAYIFRYDGSQWAQDGMLRAPDGHRGARFGYNVSLSRDVCIISAKGNRGAAYIFRYDGAHWTLEEKLTPSSVDDYDFGFSASIDRDVAIVGAPSSYGSTNSGAIYTYERSGGEWIGVRRFTATDHAPTVSAHSFGRAVSIARGYAAAGAPTSKYEGACWGAAYFLKL